MEKAKVIVAMSGGVDSSVAAYLMKQKGYDVLGAFMKNWSDTKDVRGRCLWKEERKHALQIANILDIPLITLDFEKEYRELVVKEMFNHYRHGITPNPDVDCNNKVKFPLLIKAAKRLGAQFIVTGHYAQVRKRESRYELLRAKEEMKDQSYFLYRLGQRELKWSLFPIGMYSKEQVRSLAKKLGFPNYNKKSTVGICFIGKINLKDFLKQKIKPQKGNILDPNGNIIGIHDGVFYYTIGQRLGPRFGLHIQRNEKVPHRWYVAKKNVKKNELIVAPQGHELLLRKEIWLKQFHLVDLEEFSFKSMTPLLVRSRIRNVGELLPSTLSFDSKKRLYKVVLKKAITGVSEGQALVLYKGKKVLGGGVISF